jgi:hypothetical protein
VPDVAVPAIVSAMSKVMAAPVLFGVSRVTV